MDIKCDADVSETGAATDVSRERSHKAACLARLYKAAELAMLSSDNRDSVVKLRDEIVELWDNFVKVHDCLHGLVESEEKYELEQSLQRMTLDYEELCGHIEQWINRSKPDFNVDACSNASSNSTSRRKMAELELMQLRRRQEIKLKQRQLQFELDEEEVCAKIEKAALEESFYNEGMKQEPVVDRAYGVAQMTAPNMIHDRTTAPQFDTKAEPSHSQQDTLLRGIKVISDTIQESFNLPKPEILTFSGNPADYCKFIRNFETNVESKIQDDRIKLSYLIQYCSGDARRSIEDCVVLGSDDGYRRAKQILQTRYGKSHLIARAHVDRLINGQPLKANDVQGLMDLSLEMEKCEITLSQIGFISDINNTENLRKIVKRLPMHIRSRWVERASALIESGQEPNFEHLFRFVQSRSIIANTMYGQDLAREPKSESRAKGSKKGYVREKTTTLAVQSESENEYRVLSCVFCHEKHRLKDCEKFKLIDLEAKKRVIRKHKMCDNCLNFKHFAKYCRKPSACEVSGCVEKHHSMLHPRSEDVSGHSAVTNTGITGNKVSLRILPVIVKNGSNHVQTYALLDAGSDVTLCSSKLVRKLRAKGKSVSFNITTVNKTSEQIAGCEVKLSVSSLEGLGSLVLDRVWSVDRLPISATSVPDCNELRKWEHLADVSLPRINQDEVDLLIGSDVPEAFWVEDERRGKRGEPYAIRTLLGWTVMGPTRQRNASDYASVNLQMVDTNKEIQKLWTTDFPDYVHETKTGMWQDDRQALAGMERSLCKVNGHYMLDLPWRDDRVCLPNNRSLAATRLMYLKRKLQKDAALHRQYTDTVQSYVENGYAKRLSDEDLACNRHGKIWYLPHHPVINPRKPGKVRVVFDCAAKYHGTSLNDNLHQGPDLMNNIAGVLMRFREDRVAIVADIEAMFHQVKVSDKDRDALRFLWWPDGDLTNAPQEYCMTVHLFGATSSPSCVAYSLRRTVHDNADDYSAETVTAVGRNMYVDDLLKSVNTVHIAVKTMNELRELLARGGFRLTKWLSNHKQVTFAIPEAERAKPTKTVDLENSSCLERTLGLQWNISQDCLVFDVKMREKPETKRGILSVASSLYDPLGLVAPVTLIPKLIIQNACRQGLRWDEPVCESDIVKWRDWLDNLNQLSCVRIDRCVKPQVLCTGTRIELHMFCDASEIQQMAPLPVERLTPDKPPFTYVGVDYFGPLYVKVGRGQQKRYGCLFTCLTTRAVHIEISYRIDTDSFLCALQRFMSRRGKPAKIFSDNGSNLTAGEKELRESIAEWNQGHIARHLQQKEIEWHFIPPYASHMGGVWERLVRIVKNAMKSVAKEQLLTDEALHTLACETEKIVNDRPITQVSSDCRDPEPLSPNKLLLLRPNACVPLGLFDRNDNYSKRWWRQVQYLANVFWRRWTREYIPALQMRQKWQGKKRNVAVNDLVLVCDEMLPRRQWPLGLVIQVNEGRDGLVRSCRIKVNGSVKVRPVTKLCMLEQETF